jgi:hypothetical protein
VELHVAGALAVWLAVLRLHLSLTARVAVQVVDVPAEAVPVGDGRALAGV